MKKKHGRARSENRPIAYDETIFEFAKNRREVVRAVRQNWMGRDLISLRVFYRSGDDLLPGRQGICLQASQIGELLKAVEALAAAAGEAHRIPSGTAQKQESRYDA